MHCSLPCKQNNWLSSVYFIAVSKIDPKTNQYHWVVTTDSKATTLLIFTRDPDMFNNDHLTECLDILKEKGYLTNCLTKPIEIFHGPTCNYGFPNPTNAPTKYPHQHSIIHDLQQI